MTKHFTRNSRPVATSLKDVQNFQIRAIFLSDKGEEWEGISSLSPSS